MKSPSPSCQQNTVKSQQSLKNSEDSVEDVDDERGDRNILIDPEVTPPEVMSTTGYEGLEDESISDNKLEMNMFVSVNSSSQKIDLSLYNITLATVPPGFCLSAKSGKKVPWIR